MDFDIGNIIYIVVVLVSILVGVLGKKKKPGTPASGSPGAQKQPAFMEQLEEMLNPGRQQPQVSTLAEEEPDIPVEIEFQDETLLADRETEAHSQQDYMSDYERIMKRMSDGDPDLILREAESMTEPLEVIHLDEESGTDYFEIVKEFDPGTAVVYSAIINRIDY